MLNVRVKIRNVRIMILAHLELTNNEKHIKFGGTMKKVFTIAATLLILVGCGSNKTETVTTASCEMDNEGALYRNEFQSKDGTLTGMIQQVTLTKEFFGDRDVEAVNKNNETLQELYNIDGVTYSADFSEDNADAYYREKVEIKINDENVKILTDIGLIDASLLSDDGVKLKDTKAILEFYETLGYNCLY